MEAMEDALKFIFFKKADKFLVNQRKGKTLPPEASQWFVKNWLMRLVYKMGTTVYVTIITSEDIFGLSNVKTNISKIEKSEAPAVTYKYFSTENEAIEWLETLTV